MGSAASHHSLLIKKPTAWGPFLVISLAGHFGVIAVGLFYSWLVAPPAIDFNQKPIVASLVRKGKPRDEKLLPRKEELPPPPEEVKTEAPPVPAPEAPPPVPTPAPAPSIAPAPPSPAKVAKQEGVQNTADRRKKLFGAFDKTSKKTNLDELEGAEYGDVEGDAATAEGERYWGMLSAQIRRNYDVSQTISEQERLHLKAQVRIFITKTGSLQKVDLKTSGNPLFDSAVLSAVKKASPFSPPPEHLRASLQKVGVVLEFKP
ncbi:MAG: energy transducer TonB [Myxococcaceae bacterium]